MQLQSAVDLLRDEAQSLENVAQGFLELRLAERLDVSDGSALLGELEACKGRLRNCALGDPLKSPSKPVLHSSDCTLRAFGAAGAAAFRAILAAYEWEVAGLEKKVTEVEPEGLWAAVVARAATMDPSPEPLELFSQVMAQAKSSDASDRQLLTELLEEASRMGSQLEARQELAVLLVQTAELRARLLDFKGAHLDLKKCLLVQPELRVAASLARQYAMALAASSESVLCDMSDEFLKARTGHVQHLRRTLTEAGYTKAGILYATGASSLLSLFSDGVLPECLQSCEQGGRQGELLDFIRLFLLHSSLPLERVVALLESWELCSFLLSAGALSCIKGSAATLLDPREVESSSRSELEAFANVALWPVEEDLFVATDCDEQAFAEGEFEPVMYLSVDSQALLAAAPRAAAPNVLDLCCGSGVQGLVALRYYASQVTFMDINPRALRFARFNAHLNGFLACSSFVEGDICLSQLPPELQSRGQFDAVLANPPFVPNPDNVASVCGPLYSRGGADGQVVLEAAIKCADQLLAEDGRLCAVGTVPNSSSLPARVEAWIEGTRIGGVAFCSEDTRVEDYLADAFKGRPSLERRAYVSGLRQSGVETMSDMILLLCRQLPGAPSHKIELHRRRDLWSDEEYLRQKPSEALLRGGALSMQLPVGALSSLDLDSLD